MRKLALLLSAGMLLGCGNGLLSAAEILDAHQLDEVTAGVKADKLEARIAKLTLRVTKLQDQREALVDQGKDGNGRLDAKIEVIQDRIAAIRERLVGLGSGGNASARAFVLENGVLREIDVPPGQDSVSVTTVIDHGSSGANGGMVVLTRP